MCDGDDVRRTTPMAHRLMSCTRRALAHELEEVAQAYAATHAELEHYRAECSLGYGTIALLHDGSSVVPTVGAALPVALLILVAECLGVLFKVPVG